MIKGLGFGNADNMRVGWEGVHVEKYNDDIISSTTDTLVVRVPKLKNAENHEEKIARVKISMSTQDGVVSYPSQEYKFMRSLAPVITNASPNFGLNGNQLITVQGSNFRCTTVRIEIAEKNCEITECSTDSLTCNAPFVPAGDHIMTIFDSKYGYGFTEAIVHYDLNLESISPTIGSFGGGQTITITGSGFTEETIVHICSDTCSFVSLTDSNGEQKLLCKTPSKDRSRNCKIKLENNGEFSKNAIEYSYDAIEATPVVNSITPNRGQVVGGTEVTISGSGFEGQVTVMIGDHSCEVTSVTSDEVICVTSKTETSQVLPVTVTVEKFGKQQEYLEFWYVNQWSSPRTWGCDQGEDCDKMPSDGDIIEIPEGIDLLLDESTPLLNVLIVNGGKLIFDRELG